MKIQVLVFALTLWMSSSYAGLVERMHQTVPENDHYDWRTFGFISPVKEMGSSGDSLSVVITEGVESMNAIQTTRLVELSVKEVEDCCTTDHHLPKYEGFGCITHLGGLCKATDYKRGQGKCNNATCTSEATVSGTIYIHRSEAMMKQAMPQSPLVAYLDASLPSFQAYTSGVYADPACSTTQLDHVVQVIGYGNQGDTPYWIIKNSWGVNWGEQGYMRIKRGVNQCGISNKVFFPVDSCTGEACNIVV